MTQRRPRGSAPGGSRRPGQRAAGRAGAGASSAGAPRAASSAPRGDVRARGSRLTGRAAILVLVLAVLTVSYASSLKAYLQQRSHIEALQAQIAERESNIAALEREKARWQDPEYVQQQARKRFGYLMPGERSYVVLDANGDPLDGGGTLHDPADVVQEAPTAWWVDAWGSVELAGNPPPVEAPPADEIGAPARKIRVGDG